MKNDRLFQMLYLLLDKERMSAPELAERLEVSERTVYRDVETLSMAGVPIYATPGKGGGISLLPGYSFDKTLLSDEEQNQLLFAVQSLQAAYQQINGFDADQQVNGLLQKLGTSFQKQKSDWIAVDFSRWGFPRIDTERFDLLKAAILGKKSVEITYCGTSGETTERRIHPLRLVYKDKDWYLQAYCLRVDDFRLFKIGRIVALQPTDQVFTEDYTEDIPPMETQFSPCPTTPLRLRFSPWVAFRVYDEFYQAGITREPDGSLLVAIDFPLESWTVSYLHSFATDVEVLEPIELKRQLAEHAEKIAAHHRS